MPAWFDDRCSNCTPTQREFQVARAGNIFGGRARNRVRPAGSSEVSLVVGDDDGGNGRVAHDVLADAALGREPDAAGAARSAHDEVGALLVGDATDAFADVLHRLAAHLVLQLHTHTQPARGQPTLDPLSKPL